MKNNPTIAICGAGGIGRAAALILACNPAMTPNIYLGDISAIALSDAVRWVNEGKNRSVMVKTFLMSKEGCNEEMEIVFEEADVLLDCLPGSQAPRIASLAKTHKTHYANLTEYIAETEQVIAIGKNASTGFLLQTGIAPGYVNVLACGLLERFQVKYGVEQIDSMKMRVGALSQSATDPSYYAYTWSSIGVATEYVKDTIIVRNGKVLSTPSLSDKKSIIINGEVFEEDFTSGGVANLPQALHSKIKNIDYKTLRYPGHYAWVKDSIKHLGEVEDLSSALDQFMQEYVPSIENDRIVMFAQVIGKDKQGILRSLDKSYDIGPCMVGSKTLRAIQATTATALCEAAYYLLSKRPSGPILQTDLNPQEFLNGPYVSEIYGFY